MPSSTAKRAAKPSAPTPGRGQGTSALLSGLFALAVSAGSIGLFLSLKSPDAPVTTTTETPVATIASASNAATRSSPAPVATGTALAAQDATHQDEAHEVIPVADARPDSANTSGATRAAAYDEQPAPTTQAITVVKPGVISLTPEQTEILRGAGSGWGSTSPEAQAVIDAIPAEAFTSDW